MFNFIRRYIKRNYGIDKEYFRFIDDMFGFIPNNIELYKVALIHKSASQSIGGHHINNERLEYLGDAVIESITSDYLFIAYPDRDEGFLTQMRSKLVSRQSLNEMAVFIGLDKYLICKSGATLQQKHIYGDAFEAMMGAIYLDKGYEFTNRLLINGIFERFLCLDDLCCSESDFKSRLIEWCQKNRHSLEFKTSKGSDKRSSAPIFYTTIFIDGIEMGHGVGDSKKSSEQNASCSITREMSDEECAKLLDKVDRMLTRVEKDKAPKVEQRPQKSDSEPESDENSTPEQKQVEPHKHRHGKKRKAENVSEQQTPTEEQPATVETTVVEEPQHTAKRRRGKRQNPEESAAAESAEAVVEQPQKKTTEEEPVKKERPRRKKAEPKKEQTAAESEQPAVQSAESSESAEQPAKRTRSRAKRAKTEDVQPATETTSEEQPAKKRRPRRKKSETTAAAEEQTVTESQE